MKPGDVVGVKVLDVDVARKRVSLTLRLDGPVGPRTERRDRDRDRDRRRPERPKQRATPGRGGPADTALADALRRAGLDRPPPADPTR